MIRQSTYSYKKYQSLILSCLLHALIFFLLIYTRYYRVHDAAEPLYPVQNQPAQVQLQTFRAPPPVQAATPAVHPVPAQAPTQIAPPAMQPVQAQAASAPPPPAHEVVPEPQPEPTAKESVPALPIQQKEEAPPIVKQEEEPEVPQSKPQAKASASPTKRSISPAEFMRAFKQAVREEQQEAQGQSTSTGTSYGPPHVQERLNQWSQHHYKQRIIEALRKASRLSTRIMQHTQTINTVAHITIPILKDGILGDMRKYPMSGIPEVDRYLIDVFRSADFPPIPDRYKTDRFLFKVPITISLKRGTSTYNIFVS